MMKKRLLLAYFFCMTALIGIQAQNDVWRAFPGPAKVGSKSTVNKIDFPESLYGNRGYVNGYALGKLENGKGFIVKSTSGGTSWSVVDTLAIEDTSLPASTKGIPFKELTDYAITGKYIYAWGKEATMIRNLTASGKWYCLKLPEGTGDCLSAAFVTEGTIGVVTDGNRIYFTMDGGESWMLSGIPEGTTGIRKIIYVKDNFFIAIGDNNLVLASSTSGYSWTKLEYENDGTADYSSIILKTGSVTGQYDVLLGGKNPESKPVIDKATMTVEDSKVTAFGDMYRSGTLDEEAGIKDFVLAHDKSVYALCTNGKVYQTKDDGISWTPEVLSFDDKEVLSLSITGYGVKYASGTNSLFAINTPTPSVNVTAVKKSEDTYNFSATYVGFFTSFRWEFEKGNPSSDTYSVPVVSVNFYETGEHTVTLTASGKSPGSTSTEKVVVDTKISAIKQGNWDLIRTELDNGWLLNHDIFFPERQNLVGYIVSMNGTTGDRGSIWKTENGGSTWRCVLQHSEEKEVKGLRNIWFTSMNVGYACGYAKVVWNENWTKVIGIYPQIWKTEDAGENWRLIDVSKYATEFTQEYFSSITFYDENNGVVHNQNSVYYTTDAGETWEKAEVGNTTWNNITANLSLHHLCYLDSTTVMGVGIDEQIFKSVDKGRTWNIVRTGMQGVQKQYLHIAAKDSKTIFILPDDSSEGNILMSKDGGDNWTEVLVTNNQQPVFRSMTFVNDSLFFVSGAPDVISRSENGGLTWTSEKHATLGESATALRSSATGVIFASGSNSTFKRLIPDMNADFSYKISEDFSVSFQSSSVGFITDFKWEINGEEKSTSMNPVIQLEGDKTYQVRLTVSGVDPRDGQLVTKTVEKTIEVKWSSIGDTNLTGDWLTVYPNPIADVLNVKLSLDKAANVRIVVTGVTGQKIESVENPYLAGEANITLQAGNWAKGIYFVSAYVDGKLSKTIKLIR